MAAHSRKQRIGGGWDRDRDHPQVERFWQEKSLRLRQDRQCRKKHW